MCLVRLVFIVAFAPIAVPYYLVRAIGALFGIRKELKRQNRRY